MKPYILLACLVLPVLSHAQEIVTQADKDRTKKADLSTAFDNQLQTLKASMENILRCGSQGFLYGPNYSPSSKVKHGGQQEGCLSPLDVM